MREGRKNEKNDYYYVYKGTCFLSLAFAIPPFSQWLLRIRRATLLRRLERRRTVAGPGRVLIDPKGLSLLFFVEEGQQRRDERYPLDPLLFHLGKKRKKLIEFLHVKAEKEVFIFSFPLRSFVNVLKGGKQNKMRSFFKMLHSTRNE